MKLEDSVFSTYQQWFDAEKDKQEETIAEFKCFSDIIAEAYDWLRKDEQNAIDARVGQIKALEDAVRHGDLGDLGLLGYLDPEDLELDLFSGIDDKVVTGRRLERFRQVAKTFYLT